MKTYLKVSLFSSMFTLSMLPAQTYGQNAKVTVNRNNVTVKTVLNDIESQTNYLFIYGKDINVNRLVNVSSLQQPTSSLLDKLFEGTNISYALCGNHIVLKLENEGRTATSTQQKGDTKTIKGRVLDANGEPLVGVAISIEGTNRMSTTDMDGNYSIKATEGETLKLTYIGFNPFFQKISRGNSYNITMKEDTKALDEVVVVGYGTMKKADLTGGVVNVGEKDLNRVASFNLMDKVASQIPGLNITTGNAAPGVDQSILIRGQNSLTADNAPLVVLDGIPYNGSLADLDPNTIESMSVLKDASAAAIYGSRGSNGIILIQSKKGRIGAPHVSYRGEFSISEPQHRVNVMSPEKYLRFKQDIARLQDGWEGEQLRPENILSASELSNYYQGITNDWQDIIFRTAFSHDHQISLSGGTEQTTYNAALAYLNQQGVVFNSRMERYNLDLGVTQVLNKWLTIGVNTKYIQKQSGGITPNIEHAVKQSPYGIFKEENGNYYEEPMDQSLIRNPMVDVNADQDNTSRNLIINSYANIVFPVKGFSFRTNFGYNNRTIFTGTYYGRDTFTGKSVGGKASINNTHYYDYTWENILKYNRTFRKHTIDLTGLFSLQKTCSNKAGGSAESFINDDSSFHNLSAGEKNKTVTSSLRETQMLSYMFRANYNYANRYLLTLTGRTDGYSAFGKNNKYAFFPSVAVGWNIHQEAFLANTHDWLDQLKIRVSYGSNGNQAINPYQTLDRLHIGTYVWGDNGSTANAVYLPNDGAGNPNLKWETTHTFNLGIDFSFLNGRIYGSIDTYVSNTKDLLMKRTVPIMNGYSTIMDNIGRTRNKGIEISLNTVNIKQNDLEWRTGINFSLNRDKIIDVRGDKKDDITNKWFIGQPIQVYYDYKVVGIWQEGDTYTTTDANGNTVQIQKGAKPGSAKLQDTNGDGVINSNDKVIIGSKKPSFRMAMTNELTWRNFYFSSLISGTFKVTRELNEANIGSWAYNLYNYLEDADYWTPENPNAKYCSPVYSNFDGHTFYHDFTYIQIKNITVGYNLNHSLVKRMHLQGASVNLSVNNAWTFCDIRSMLNYDNSWFASYPTARSYVLGINLTF